MSDPETEETWTGDLEIVTQGTAVGDVVVGDASKFVETRGVLSIRGTTGELAAVQGHGTVSGIANSQSSSNNYTAKIRLPNP